MQLTVDIQYDQLIHIIRHLPANQLAKIKNDLDNTVSLSQNDKEKTSFQKFLLAGPIMSDAQYVIFKNNRKSFNQWRSK